MAREPDHQNLDERVYENITGDEYLPDGKKAEVLSVCRSLPTEEATGNAFNGFAQKNRLVGALIVPLEDNERVGHIKTIHSAARYLAVRLTRYLSDGDAIEEHRVVDKFRAVAQPTITQDKREALAWFEDELFSREPGYTLSGSPAWLFREEAEWDARKLLGSPEAHSLPCRLGLPEPLLWGAPPYSYTPGIEFIGFALTVDSVPNARRPTALDGDYDTVKRAWIFGGRTRPLPHAPKKMQDAGGLLELVCQPPKLASALGSVYVFEN